MSARTHGQRHGNGGGENGGGAIGGVFGGGGESCGGGNDGGVRGDGGQAGVHLLQLSTVQVFSLPHSRCWHMAHTPSYRQQRWQSTVLPSGQLVPHSV